MSRLQKGFTLIELLVVIAIIGILSSVVLASLNTARGKGGNAAVKSNLQAIRSQAEIVYDDLGGSYGAQAFTTACHSVTVATPATQVFNDSTVQKAVNAARAAAGNPAATYCWATAANWSATVGLKVAEGSNNFWCVDSSGQSKGEPNFPTSGAICP
ncbi:type II secretion system protein [Patescibacteria group bacterium]|nr:MAG: type II secretion system protein [Patescibacteria group bacterium]